MKSLTCVLPGVRLDQWSFLVLKSIEKMSLFWIGGNFLKEFRLCKLFPVLTQKWTFYSHLLLSVLLGNHQSLGGFLKWDISHSGSLAKRWRCEKHNRCGSNVCVWKGQGQRVRARCPARHSIAVISAESGQVLQLLGRGITLASYTDHLKASGHNCSGKD